MSVSFYRKYRPQRFADLDLDQVRGFFLSLLESGKFGQSYLFAGPKGTGKTSAARILAMTLNCEENAEAVIDSVEGGKNGVRAKTAKLKEPCGKCTTCTDIRKGRSSAVVEIDAASNRGIDDIRALRQRVGLMPTSGSYSVFIVDEVHMLTKEAFNALLKTLEEPPAHVVFCLCTTEAHKLPDTIVSRCTEIRYTKATEAEMVRSLKRVVEGEEIEIETEALRAIARVVEGSFRDATKVLEMLSVSGVPITVAMVESEVGSVSGVETERLLDMVLEGRVKEGLSLVGEMERAGMDMKLLTQGLIELARARLMEGVNNGEGVRRELVELMEMLAKAFSRFADVPMASLPLEMAVVEYGLKVGGISESSGGLRVAVEKKVAVEKVKEVEEVEQVAKEEKPLKVVKTKVSEVGEQDEGDEDRDEEVRTGSVVDEKGKLNLLMTEVEDKWAEILKLVEAKNHGLVTVMRGTRLRACEQDMVTLTVAYKFHKERLEQDRYLVLLEEVMSEVFGGRVRLRFVLEEGKRQMKVAVEHENISGAIPEEDVELVKAAEEIFG